MIGSVVEQGSMVYIYNERGAKIAAVMGGNGYDEGLKGWTSSTVSVKRGTLVYIYDERGNLMSAVPG